MPRTKEQYEVIRNEKKQLIKETALRLFVAKGYITASISDIAEDAGISKGLMYNYFNSKEDLLHSIMNDLANEFADMVDPDHDGMITTEEAKGFIDKLFDMLMRRKDEFKLYYQLSAQPQVMDYLTKQFNYMEKLVYHRRLMVEYFSRKFKILDSMSAYFTIVSFLKGFSIIYVHGEEFSDEFMMRYKEELKKILFSE